MADKTRKALNFDLNTADLKKYYPGKSYRNAYKDIKKFLCNHGFVHRQWSGYLSVENMSDYEIKKTIHIMTKSFPWLKKCVSRFDVTDIGKQHDLTNLITGKTRGKIRENDKESVQAQKPIFNREKLQQAARQIKENERKQPQKTKLRKNDLER